MHRIAQTGHESTNSICQPHADDEEPQDGQDCDDDVRAPGCPELARRRHIAVRGIPLGVLAHDPVAGSGQALALRDQPEAEDIHGQRWLRSPPVHLVERTVDVAIPFVLPSDAERMAPFPEHTELPIQRASSR